MTGFWLVSYAALWCVVLVIAFLQLATLQQFGLQRHKKLSTSIDDPSRVPSYEEDGPAIGDAIPNITVPSGNNRGDIDLRQYAQESGVLVVFLSTVCEGCHAIAQPLITHIGERQRMPTLVVLQGREPSCQTFLRAFPLDAPVIFDSTFDMNHLGTVFGVRNSPYGLLYGPGATLLRKGSVDTAQRLSALLGDVSVSEETKSVIFPSPLSHSASTTRS